MAGRWSRRLCVTLCGLLVLTGCTDGETKPEPPAPVVSTEEFERRLTEHLSRAVDGALEAEAKATQPDLSRIAGCADLRERGPDWGVRPRAQITVAAGEKAAKYFDDVDSWALGEDFAQRERRLRAATPSAGAEPAEVRRVTATHEDGTELLMELPLGSDSFTVTLTGPCTWPPERPGGPPPGRLAPLPPSRWPTQSIVGRDACESPKLYVYNTGSQPFAGPGPHLMALVEVPDETDMEYDEFRLPEGYEPRHKAGIPDRDLDEVQLLVCVRVTATRDSGQHVTCAYTPSLVAPVGNPFTFNLFESLYHVTVREARTGAKVKEYTVPGRARGEDNCPFTMEYNRKLARGIDTAAFHRGLRPLFEARR